jgi:hypothetical protein
MSQPTQWNDPKATWPLASFKPVERRAAPVERREDEKRATKGERRKPSRRSLRSLLRL